MNVSRVALISFACVVGACGSPQEEPKDGADPTATAVETATTSEPTSSAPTVSAVSPRAKQTGLILKAISGAEIDAHQKSRIVAVGLSEEPAYKLSTSWVKTLEAAAGRMVDPSQCETLLQVTLDEPDVKPAAEKRCGKLEALRQKLIPLKGAARTEGLAKVCNIEGVKGSDKVTPFAVLAAALVQDELAAQPETTAEEKELALHLRRLCVPEPE